MATKNKSMDRVPTLKMNPKVDFYFSKAKKWHDELEKLRKIVLDCGLTEELKWGVPCYTFQESNVVFIHVFKEILCRCCSSKCVLFKRSPKGILIQQTKNVQAGRGRFGLRISWRNCRDGANLEIIHSTEAIEVEKVGLKVKKKETSDYTVPERIPT